MTSKEQEHVPVDILATLQDLQFACTSIDRISGGVSNFTYRGVLHNPLPDGSETVIIKHAEPYIPFAPSFKYAVDRSQFEHQALKALETFPGSGSHVATPRPLHFDSQSNTQVIVDCPHTTDLKNFIRSHPISVQHAARIGLELGKWAKAFHAWGAASNQAAFRRDLEANKTAANLKFAVNYGRLALCVEKFPEILSSERELFEEVAEKMKSELNGTGTVVIHGDFWTGNILAPLPHEDVLLPDPLQLVVLDWELCHLSHPALDLGQLFAELYFLTHFQDIAAGAQTIVSFMEAYGPVDTDMACRIVMHAGVHFINWNGNWKQYGDDKVVDIVTIGKELVRAAWERNIEALRESCLGVVVRGL